MNKVVQLKPFDDNHFFVLLEDWLSMVRVHCSTCLENATTYKRMERRIYNKVLLKIYISMQGLLI